MVLQCHLQYKIFNVHFEFPPNNISVRCNNDNIGSAIEQEISHSTLAPFEMTATQNREGVKGKVAALPQLFPLPLFIYSGVSFRTQ